MSFTKKKHKTPQSLTKNYVHLVWSTKYRHPFIDKAIQEELYTYLGDCCKEFECWPRAIGGIEDHVHIACILSKKIALCDFAGKIKSNSSNWIKTKGEAYQKFYWRDGYGAFSFSEKTYKYHQLY